MHLTFSSILFVSLTIYQAWASASPALVARQDVVITITKTAGSSPTSTASSAPEFVSPESFTSAVLNSTNTYRTQHDVPPLAYNETLSSFADDYLSGMSGCDFEHSGGPFGENLAIGCSDVTGCVGLWGDERSLYDFGSPGFDKSTGHFTQLVWKNTTDVGCGRKWCGQKSRWYLVCEYWPRGNILGRFDEQVLGQVSGSVKLLETKLAVKFKLATFWMGILIFQAMAG